MGVIEINENSNHNTELPSTCQRGDQKVGLLDVKYIQIWRKFPKILNWVYANARTVKPRRPTKHR